MKLNRKHFSVRPTQHGFLFLAILIAMLLGSINYNNNAGFILVFLLGGMALISIFHSFKNLVGIQIDFLSPVPVFAGQSAIFPVRIRPSENGCRSVSFALGELSISVSIDRETTLHMRLPARDRGYLQPKLLAVKSVYPFGLFTFCTRLSVGAICLVYPRPIPGVFKTAGTGYCPDGEEETARGGADDFQGLTQYQPGHSINRISWKALSRGKGLFIKDFTADDSPCVMLDFDALSGRGMEYALSRLCDMILFAHQQQMEYGLKLPGFVRNPAWGDSHQHHCLKALAVFDLQKGGG